MFLTMDVEIVGDVPSRVFAISINEWNRGVLNSSLYYLINPEDNYDDKLNFIYGINGNIENQSYKLEDIWQDVYQILENKLVVVKNSLIVDVLFKTASSKELEIPKINVVNLVDLFNNSYNDDLPEPVVDLHEIQSILNLNATNHAYYNSLSIKSIIEFLLISNFEYDLKVLLKNKDVEIKEYGDCF